MSNILHGLPKLTHICQRAPAFGSRTMVITVKEENSIPDAIYHSGPVPFLLIRQ